MSVLNPAGLWGLLGIPVLILIYIIKPKFQEKLVTSTFIWKLSRKYKKKSLPWQINNILLFLIQLLTIGMLSLIMARPVIATEDGAVEKIVILDASASMRVEQKDGSRFELAKEQIFKLADDMESYGKMTVILAGQESRILLERSDSEQNIKAVVEAAECTYGEANLNEAFLLTEQVLKQNPAASVYLYTDKEHEENGSIKVVNVAEKAWNVSVQHAKAERAGNQDYVFSAELTSYGMDIPATVVLYVDGVLADAQLVGLMADVPAVVEFQTFGLRQFHEARIYVEAADSILEDNEYYLWNEKREDYEVLLVSEEPTFWEAALLTFDNIRLTTVASLEELDQGAQWRPNGVIVENIPGNGYDLYIYEGEVPTELPKDGAVWMIAPEQIPKGVTVKLGESIIAENYLETAPNSGSELFEVLSKDVVIDEVYINEYQELSSILGFETLYTCNGMPVILAGESENVRTVVFAFRLNASNLPLRIAFPALVYHLVQYSLCPVLDAREFTVGEEVILHKANGAVLTAVRAGNPEAVAEHYARMPVSLEANVPGTYFVSQIMSDESVTELNYFVHLAPEESNLSAEGECLPVFETAGETIKYEKEITGWVVLILLLLIVVEWGLQYREQF